MDQFRKYSGLAAGLLGFAAPTYFGWVQYRTNAEQNVATWSMVLALDVLGLVLAYRSGNTRPYLQIGWVVAATCIMAGALMSSAPLNWGWVETVCVLLCCLTVYFWLSEERRGEQRNMLRTQITFLSAFSLSFLPLIVQYASKPQKDTVWLWELTIASCLLSILAAEKKDFNQNFFSYGAIGINGVITLQCLL